MTVTDFSSCTTSSMCTQEVIWCACGHGEFLPIVKCQQADLNGVCYTILHGNHNVVVPGACSACIAGLTRLQNLPAAHPQDATAQMIEVNRESRLSETPRTVLPMIKEELRAGNEQIGDPPQELTDVVMTDFDNFTLDPELWQNQY